MVKAIVVNTYHAGHWFHGAKLCFFPRNSNISQVISGIIKPILGLLIVGTYLNAFLTVIPNMVLKFNNVDLFYKMC